MPHHESTKFKTSHYRKSGEWLSLVRIRRRILQAKRNASTRVAPARRYIYTVVSEAETWKRDPSLTEAARAGPLRKLAQDDRIARYANESGTPAALKGGATCKP